ncbi:MAG: (Fe-S)-binding protein [Planctomycetia bacterium]|nr:(Fe-S)-binding protein [Planctomycetia bacterium]
MQLSQRNKETVDACRFCWMCRHICPIGNATGMERNTSRARALGLSMVLRNVETLESVMDNIYECSLCGACTKECKTGWDPVQFTTEAKLEGAAAGVTPAYIVPLIEKVLTSGNIYGENKLDAKLAKEIGTLPKTADTVLYLGTDARFRTPELAVKAIQLLKKAGLQFTVLAAEPGSGYDLYFLAGAAEETRKRMSVAAETLSGFKTVIAYDPNDARMFLRQYKEWGVVLKAKVKTFTDVLAGQIRTKKLSVKKGALTYTFQDPASLARDLEETVPARKVLGACGGIREMLLHGKDTNLAGSLVMNEYMPEVMRKVAESRWRDAAGVGATILVTASPSEYVLLKATKPETMQILAMEEVVAKCL